MKLRFSIRDLAWLALVVALVVGWCEWQEINKKKFPHYFQIRDQPVFAFAGLWERWDKAEPALETCTILTTRANELQGKYHDRMPVILSPNDYATWLDPTKDPESLRYLFEPYPAAEMMETAVNPRGEQCPARRTRLHPTNRTAIAIRF